MFDFFYKNRGQIASLTLEHLWLVGIAIVQTGAQNSPKDGGGCQYSQCEDSVVLSK